MQDSSASLIQSETFFVMGSAVPASVQPLGIHCRDILENEWNMTSIKEKYKYYIENKKLDSQLSIIKARVLNCKMKVK